MNDLFWVDVVSRILHISTAIALIGGAVFTTFVLHPVIVQLSDAEKEKIQPLVISRWKWFVHFGILLFLVTGFYNYFRAMPLHKGDGLYHAMIGTKMLLAFWVMFLASALAGRSQRFAGMRNNRGFWGKVLVGSALIILCISGFVKTRSSISPPLNTPALNTIEIAEAIES